MQRKGETIKNENEKEHQKEPEKRKKQAASYDYY